MIGSSARTWLAGAIVGALLLTALGALIWNTQSDRQITTVSPVEGAVRSSPPDAPPRPAAADQPVGAGVVATAPRSPVQPGVPVTDGAGNTSSESATQLPAPISAGSSDRPAAAASGTTDAVGRIPIGRPGAPSLQQIQAELQALTAGGRQPTPAEVERVLAKLQDNQGSAVVAGVNLEVLRHNLRVAEQMRVLALEVQRLSAQPTPENTARMQQLSAQLMQLQGQLQPDIRTAAPLSSEVSR